MTGKIMPLRERDTSTIQAAADAFLSSPRYANPNTRRGYTGVLDRVLAGLGAGRPLAEVSGQIKDFLVQGQRDTKLQQFVDQVKTKSKVEILV